MHTAKSIARWIVSRSPWIPVAIAAVYLVLWSVGEAGRYPFPYPVFGLFTIAIALSGWRPLISLSIITAIPIVHLFEVMYPPTANNWPAYMACGFIAFIIALGGEGLARRLVIPVGFVVSILFALRILVRWNYGFGDGGFLSSSETATATFLLVLFGSLIFYFGLWALGFGLRSLLKVRAMGHVLDEAEDRLHEADFELRLSQDRARISRDVHDSLAHSLAVIVSQAEGAIALGPQKPKVLSTALDNIVTVARTALVDVRALVERIHDQDVTAASPRIDDIGDLIEHLRSIGMSVTFRALGQPVPMPDSHELAVFRIVQESLTNALKHSGPPVSANVTLDWQGPGLAVLVTSRGSETQPESAERGVGIEGMKERARLAGGWLTAAPADDDFFIVTGYIPTAPIAIHA